MKSLVRQMVLWCCILAGTNFAFAQNLKIAPDLIGILTGALAPVNVVVQYQVAPTLADILELVSLGGVIHYQYTVIPGVSVTLPAVSVTTLSLLSSVAYITPDRSVAPLLDLTRDATNADYAFQSGYTGAGVGIAILDSGIYAHPDVASRIVYRQSFVAKTNDDDYGHGTHVAGIAAGSGTSSTGSQYTRTFRGIAPGSNLQRGGRRLEERNRRGGRRRQPGPQRIRNRRVAGQQPLRHHRRSDEDG